MKSYHTRVLLLTAVFCLSFSFLSFSQNRGKVSGHVFLYDSACAGMVVAIDSVLQTITDKAGYFEFNGIENGKRQLEVLYFGKPVYTKAIYVSSERKKYNINLVNIPSLDLDEIVINGRLHLNGLGRMEPIRGTAIFEAKKNDVLVMKNINANMATNNTRQVFAKVAGTNVWENDGSGIQVNVSSRGLSPNRSWEYNMRQNEYDIAADILGYPDMYYSPPMDAISQIEVVRGSASLQYGTQMGGLLNFVLKKGSKVKPIEAEIKQSVGSYGLFNSYNSVGGTIKKWNYFGYFHHRNADGWRENSDYKWNTGFVSVSYEASDKFKISAEYTRMSFLLHLSAGLTDSMYEVNARRSVRERNWFNVNWNIPSLKLEYKFTDHSRISMVSYMLLSSRKSIENTKPVNIIADTGYRDIRVDRYRNFGTEIRYINEYRFSPKFSGVLAGGLRLYSGRTLRGQGLGSARNDPDFSFLHPDNLEYSDYNFRNLNLALFVENIFRVGKFSVVPGIRFENIKFLADGYYNTTAGVRTEEKGITSKRQFPLLGVGMEYELSKEIDIYANFTQGYRAANFNDIRITSPNLEIDPDLKDSRGNNIDIGFRGKYKNFLSFDVSGFYLSYNDRVGIVTRKRPDNSFYNLSTNIASSKNTGIETFAELNIIKAFNAKAKENLMMFVSYAYIDARYVESETDLLKDKKVETAPNNILRCGLTYKDNRFSSTLNYSYISQQFSDANNTVSSVSGSYGIVPAYYVMDLSSKVSFNAFKIGFTVNNITGNKYFTRRATSYPGPGLIPAEPRTILVTAEFVL